MWPTEIVFNLSLAKARRELVFYQKKQKNKISVLSGLLRTACSSSLQVSQLLELILESSDQFKNKTKPVFGLCKMDELEIRAEI